MPRIIYTNPLSPLGPGLKSGMDVIQEQERHDTAKKLAEKRMQAFDVELQQSVETMDQRRQDRDRQQQDTRRLGKMAGGMQDISPDQRLIIEGMQTPEGVEQATQLALADAEQRKKKQRQGVLDDWIKDIQSNPTLGVDPNELSAALAGVDPDDVDGRIAAVETVVATSNHRNAQVQQRDWAIEQLAIMRTAPETSEMFVPPLAGDPRSATYERIEELQKELSEPPRRLGEGRADYIGALSELEILVNPRAQGGLRRMREQNKADFDAAMAALKESGALPGPRGGGAGDQDVIGGGAAQAPVGPPLPADAASASASGTPSVEVPEVPEMPEVPATPDDVIPGEAGKKVLGGQFSEEDKDAEERFLAAAEEAGYDVSGDVSKLPKKDQEEIRRLRAQASGEALIESDAKKKRASAKENSKLTARLERSAALLKFTSDPKNLEGDDEEKLVTDLMKLKDSAGSLGASLGEGGSSGKVKVFDTRDQAREWLREHRRGDGPPPEDPERKRIIEEESKEKPVYKRPVHRKRPRNVDGGQHQPPGE